MKKVPALNSDERTCSEEQGIYTHLQKTLHLYSIHHNHRLPSRFQCFTPPTLHTSQSQTSITISVLCSTYTHTPQAQIGITVSVLCPIYSPYITITGLYLDYSASSYLHSMHHNHRLVSEIHDHNISCYRHSIHHSYRLNPTSRRTGSQTCIRNSQSQYFVLPTLHNIIVTDLTPFLAGPEVKHVLEIHNHNVSCYRHSIHHSYRLNPISRRTGSQNLRWPRDRGRHLAEHQDRSAGWEKCQRWWNRTTTTTATRTTTTCSTAATRRHRRSLAPRHGCRPSENDVPPCRRKPERPRLTMVSELTQCLVGGWMGGWMGGWAAACVGMELRVGSNIMIHFLNILLLLIWHMCLCIIHC